MVKEAMGLWVGLSNSSAYAVLILVIACLHLVGAVYVVCMTQDYVALYFMVCKFV